MYRSDGPCTATYNAFRGAIRLIVNQTYACPFPHSTHVALPGQSIAILCNRRRVEILEADIAAFQISV